MIKWLELEEEATWKESISLIYCYIFLDFLWNIIVWLGFKIFEIDFPHRNSSGTIPILVWSFPLFLLKAVCFEEILFRLPLAILIERRWKLKNILFSAVALSVLFGTLHGSFKNILSQGVGGLLYSILFLKCGGWHRHYLKALTVTIIAHYIWNVLLVLLLLKNGVVKM